MENYFFLLELPFDSSDLNEETIQQAIARKQHQWSQGLCHPIKRVFCKKCLEQLPNIEATMLNPAARAEEARKASDIKSSAEKKLKNKILLHKQTNAAIDDGFVARLVKEYISFGFSKEEILAIIQHLDASTNSDAKECIQPDPCIPPQKQAQQLSVGVDFGASFIKIAVSGEDGVVKVVRDDEGMTRFPATVVFDNEGYMHAGQALEQIDEALLHRTSSHIRSTLFNPRLVDGVDVTRESIGFLLKVAVDFAEEYWRELYPDQQVISNTIVCFPSWFTRLEKIIFTHACINSGVKLAGFMEESSAIAAAYDIVTGNEGKSFLIFDLGASTLFVGRILIRNHSVILEQSEHCDIAGTLWRESILYHILDQLDLSKDNIEFDAAMYLMGKATQAKEALTHSNTTEILVQLPELSKTITLSRSQFEFLSAQYTERVVQIAQRVAGDAPLFQILLAGGESNMPMIREALEKAFGIEVRKLKPESVVSIGAISNCGKSLTIPMNRVIENYYILLELPFDPPEDDTNTIREAITAKQTQWSLEECNPVRRAIIIEYLAAVEDIRKVMLDPVARRKEAARAKQIKNSKVKELETKINLFRAKSDGLSERDLKHLVTAFGKYGFTAEEIKEKIKQGSKPTNASKHN